MVTYLRIVSSIPSLLGSKMAFDQALTANKSSPLNSSARRTKLADRRKSYLSCRAPMLKAGNANCSSYLVEASYGFAAAHIEPRDGSLGEDDYLTEVADPRLGISWRQVGGYTYNVTISVRTYSLAIIVFNKRKSIGNNINDLGVEREYVESHVMLSEHSAKRAERICIKGFSGRGKTLKQYEQ